MSYTAVRDETEALAAGMTAGHGAVRGGGRAGPRATTAQLSAYGWGRYHRQAGQLPPDQQRALIELGEAIKRSFQVGRAAVCAVQIEGHADYDTPLNLQRGRQVSVERAEAAATWGWERLGSKAEIVGPRMMIVRRLPQSDFARSHFGEIAR